MSDFRYSRQYRGPLKAVILDWAGTTIDYGCMAPVACFRRCFSEQGVEVSVEEARRPMGMFKKDHIRTMAQMPRVSEAWREVHGRLPEEKDIEAMFHTFVPLQIECLPEHCEPVPGLGEAIESFRQSGLKVGSTTGYTSQMMEVVQPIARELGYAPDAVVAVDQVAAGRPSPWMALRNAELFDAWPLEACVKIGDTVADIREGLNASMWSIGVARTGNELGLSLEEERATDAQVLDAKLAEARERLLMAGAHYVVDSITDCPAILERISDRVRRGERP